MAEPVRLTEQQFDAVIDLILALVELKTRWPTKEWVQKVVNESRELLCGPTPAEVREEERS